MKALTVLLPALYALAAANSIVLFVTKSGTAQKASKPLLGVTLGVHLVALALCAIAARSCPLGSLIDATGVMAFSLVAVYFFLEIRSGSGSRPTGILILPLAFLLMFLRAAFGGECKPGNANLANPWFSVHVLSAVFGVAALAVAFVHGTFYLLLYREIKEHRFGLLFRRLPPLAALSRMSLMASVIGWILLTVTLAAGYVWSIQGDRLDKLHGDPLFLVTVGVWLIYAVGLSVRYLAGWRHRFTVYLSICGFALMILSMILVFLAPAMHGSG